MTLHTSTTGMPRVGQRDLSIAPIRGVLPVFFPLHLRDHHVFYQTEGTPRLLNMQTFFHRGSSDLRALRCCCDGFAEVHFAPSGEYRFLQEAHAVWRGVSVFDRHLCLTVQRARNVPFPSPSIVNSVLFM